MLLAQEDQSEGVEGSRIPQRGDETAQRANRMTATACAGEVGLSDQKGRDLMTHTCKRSSKTGSTVRTPRASRTDEETGTRTRKSSSRTRQTSLSASRSASSTHSRNGRREIVRTQAGRMSKRAPNDVSGEPLRVLRLEISEGSSGVEGSESSGVAQSGSTTPTASDDVSTIEEEEVHDECVCTCVFIHVPRAVSFSTENKWLAALHFFAVFIMTSDQDVIRSAGHNTVLQAMFVS